MLAQHNKHEDCQMRNSQRNTTPMLVLAIIFSLLFVIWGGTRIVAHIQFGQNVSGYLKRAADANTIPLAGENLDTALKYIEGRGMTSGSTFIVYQTPDEDVGFWYKNLKASRAELSEIKPETSLLERTNVLIKLRETLVDHKGSDVKATIPPGIEVFPSNVFFALWGWISGILALLFFWFWIRNDYN